MNWMDALQNPKGWGIRRAMSVFLKDKYNKNEEILERISSSIVTEKDAQQFNALITDVYELGFMSAVDQHREQLEKMGIKATIRNQSNEGH